MSETTTTTEPAGTAPLLGAEAGNPATPAADAREWLPEEYRVDPVFKDLKDPGALAKSYKNAASLVGLDKGAVLRIPADGDEAAMAEVFTRLGRPEKPEGYSFPELPGPLLEGVEPAARQAFHQLGLSAKQAQGVMALYGGQVQQAEAGRLERAAQMEAAVEADLKTEWGQAFDDRLHAANRAISEIGGKDLGRLLTETRMPDGTRMGNHPVLIKAFAEIGRRLSEPGDLRGGSGGGGPRAPATAEEAQAEIKALTTDKEFHEARRDPRHVNHAAATERWNQLNTAIAGGRNHVP